MLIFLPFPFFSVWYGEIFFFLKFYNFQMALFISFKQILEKESDSMYEIFKPEFDKLLAGTLSVPINIPGSNYHYGFQVDSSRFKPKFSSSSFSWNLSAYFNWDSLQGRKGIIKILSEIIKERRASSITHDDILDHLLRNEGSKFHLSDEEILDQIIAILYSGYETVSSTTMMAIKYLHDHPDALQQVRVSEILLINLQVSNFNGLFHYSTCFWKRRKST